MTSVSGGSNLAPMPALDDTSPAAANDAHSDGDTNNDTESVDEGHGCCVLEEKCDDQCAIFAATLSFEKGSIVGSSVDQPRSNTFDDILERYRSLLDKAICICRSVVEDKGVQVSCCQPKKALATQPNQAKSEPCSSKVEAGQNACCSSDANKSDAATVLTGHKDKPSSGSKDKTSCCDSALTITKAPTKSRGCGSDAIGNTATCANKALGTIGTPSKGATRGSTRRHGSGKDVEKDAGYEHVAISVEGMHCNDCADKLLRALASVPGTRNVRVNFIRGQADFDIEPSVTDIDSILAGARTATGYVMNRMKHGGGEILNLLVSGPAGRVLSEMVMDGLKDVVVINKSTVQVEYEPTAIGARDLLDKIGELSTGLAPPGADPAVSGGRRKFHKLLLLTVLSTILTIPVVVLAWGEGLVSEFTRGIISFVLGSLVQLLAIPVFYQPAIRALIMFHALELDMLVVISITAAYLYSIVAFGFRMAGKPLETAEFFETSTLLITLVMLGRLLASFARIRAVAAVSMRSLQSTTALLVEDTGKSEREIDSRLLQYGDVFKVLPHCRIPTDGVVIDGVSDVDESMLTGESIPVVKQPGSLVIAGTVNSAGTLLVRLTELPGKNTVMDIARMVEEASNSKPRVQDLADRVASYFLPVVGGVSVLVFIIWVIVGIKGRGESAAQAVPVAITYAIAVLAVSCPCALGLAVPMVLIIAGGIAARGGLIIKSAECTERARKVTDVVFDKTGTLTEPDLDVLEEDLLGHNREETASIVKALVSESKHPVSLAVAKYLADVGHTASVSDLQSIPGAGVEAQVGDAIFRAGNPRWTGHEEHPRVRQFLENGLTILLVTRGSTPMALFGLRTRIRPEAASVISTLKGRGITVHLVSGDQARAVEAIASSVGIDSANAVAQYAPDQKQAYVASLMEENKYVLFCGDGTNDAVAVAQANIGAQVSDSVASSDVTGGAADVVLLSGLQGIPFLLDISKASFKRIVFNFAWSATYNLLAILLAGGAFVKIRIAPAYAGAGEMVSVLPVIAAAVSMLLLKFKQ